MNTRAVCGKCGKSEEYYDALADGWLIAQRIDKPEGYYIIRCPEHITDHARRQAGLRQEYYHQHKNDRQPQRVDSGSNQGKVTTCITRNNGGYNKDGG